MPSRRTSKLTGRVAARYRGCGRFATHYVAGKLRHDPLTEALLTLGAADPFGDVVDVGCGRGQFSGLVLEAGLARSVVGLDANATLLAQAERALSGLPFRALRHDLAADPALPAADTVMVLDVLYQLPTEAQARLLAAAARAARRLVLIRTADPARGWRAWLTRGLEVAARRVWPHSGAAVNARPVAWIGACLTEAGWSVGVAPCWKGTPFGNVLLTARPARWPVAAQVIGAAPKALVSCGERSGFIAAMSTDGLPKPPLADQRDWPGREQGVPPPPSREGVEEISRDQDLITDEWAPTPAPRTPPDSSG